MTSGPQKCLDQNAKKYITLQRRDQPPKQILIKSLPCPESKIIVASIKEYGFTAIRVAMLKNTKIGYPMSL